MLVDLFLLWRNIECSPEDVVNEEEHVLSLRVTEVLGDGEAGQSDTSASARRLVHLTVHERHLK